MKSKKINLIIIFPIIAIISLCALTYVNSLPSNETAKRDNVEIYVNGEKANDYENAKDFMLNVTVDDGMPDTIKAESTTVINNQNQSSKSYCGNKNSKVFHTLSCTYAKNMNDENKVYFTSKDECTTKGYRACSRCKP